MRFTCFLSRNVYGLFHIAFVVSRSVSLSLFWDDTSYPCICVCLVTCIFWSVSVSLCVSRAAFEHWLVLCCVFCVVCCVFYVLLCFLCQCLCVSVRRQAAFEHWLVLWKALYLKPPRSAETLLCSCLTQKISDTSSYIWSYLYLNLYLHLYLFLSWSYLYLHFYLKSISRPGQPRRFVYVWLKRFQRFPALLSHIILSHWWWTRFQFVLVTKGF